MRWDVLRGLGILLEAFCELLRDCSGCTNVFRLGEEFGCPDSVALLKRLREASGHFYGSGAEVDLRVVLVQPGEPEYHALFTEAGDCKQNAFRMSFVGHDYVDDFADASGFVKHSVYVVNRDRLG